MARRAASTKRQVWWLVAMVAAVACLVIGLSGLSADGVDCGSAFSPRDVTGAGETVVERIRANIVGHECSRVVESRRKLAGVAGVGSVAAAWVAIRTGEEVTDPSP